MKRRTTWIRGVTVRPDFDDVAGRGLPPPIVLTTPMYVVDAPTIQVDEGLAKFMREELPKLLLEGMRDARTSTIW